MFETIHWITYNVEENIQRHYLGHTDDIKCIAIHPDLVTVATGQVAGHDSNEGKPHVRVWRFEPGPPQLLLSDTLSHLKYFQITVLTIFVFGFLLKY